MPNYSSSREAIPTSCFPSLSSAPDPVPFSIHPADHLTDLELLAQLNITAEEK
jgi:hypothetical protein